MVLLQEIDTALESLHSIFFLRLSSFSDISASLNIHNAFSLYVTAQKKSKERRGEGERELTGSNVMCVFGEEE